MYKVLIADDEAIIRGGLARFVESDPEFRVVATAEDGPAPRLRWRGSTGPIWRWWTSICRLSTALP